MDRGGPPRSVKRKQEATVRIGGVGAIPEVLHALGVDAGSVLIEAGLDPQLFDDPEHPIAYHQRDRLLRLCIQRTGCRHFGLLVGQRGGLHSLGLVGLLAKYAPDVGTALRCLTRYFHLHARGATIQLTTRPGVASFTYDSLVLGAETDDQIGDGAVAMMLSILRALCGPGFKPTEARFAHRRPDDDGPFRRHFCVPLRFDADQYALLFAADWLQRPVPAADAALERLLRQQIETLESRHPDDFPAQVRRVLQPALLTGRGGAAELAALFSLHPRTLRRRLQQFGTSVQALADECRHAIAQQMLQDTALPVAQIAAALDYADASAFTRAFRRWTGNTPARWRALRHEHSVIAAPTAYHRLEARPARDR
jgi:AraC-like DNA-binding protein